MMNLKAAIRRIACSGLLFNVILAPIVVAKDHNDTSHAISSEKLDRFLNEHVSDNLSGTLLIAQNGKIIHSQGYGFANREENIPNTSDTIFEIGALTRYFTAAAILKLVEQNKLALNDTLTEFFADVPENKQHITIHNLLTHTPGLLGDEELDAFKDVGEDIFLKDVFSKPDTYRPAIFLPTFKFEVGKRAIEFSEGYNLLALIIEKVSGQSFEVFLNDQMFEPAGIVNTGYQSPDWKPQQLANGYHGESGENWGSLPERLASGDQAPVYMRGSFGLLSSVEDLYKWHQALHAGKVLRKDLVELLHKRHIAATVSFESDVDYGYGIQISETWAGTPWIYNARNSTAKDNIPDFIVRYNYFPDEDVVIIFASNERATRNFYDTIYKLIRTLLEPDYEVALKNAEQAE